MLTTLVVGVCTAYWLWTRSNSYGVSLTASIPNAVKFGIAGKIDIDRDGRNDLAQLIKLIEANGGQVSYIKHEDGTALGKLTPKTSFLIIDSMADNRISSNTSLKEAAGNGIVVMELPQLLKHTGRQNAKGAGTRF